MPGRHGEAGVRRRTLLLGGLAAGAGALASACASSSATTSPTASGTASPADAAARNGADQQPVRPDVRFGLNYTPSKWWWYVWQNWEPARVADDLAQIASLGMDHIRAQLMWDIFQPAADTVDTQLLGRLEQLLDIADQHKLDVDVSVLTGYLSGHQYIPDWARAGNWVNRPDLVAGEVTFFRRLGEAVGQHPRLMGFDLGNELLGRAPCRDLSELGIWASTLLSAARDGSPDGLHTVSATGTYLPPYPTISAVMGDVSVVHPWYFLQDAVVDGKLRDDPLHHVEYNIEYMKSFHDFAPHEPRRQVWVQEVGAPGMNFAGTVSIPVSLQPEFATASYRNALTCEDLFAITWWDSHDIDLTTVPTTFHEPEPTLGIFDVNGKEKPIGSAISSVIKDYKAGRLELPASRSVAIVGDNDVTFSGLYAEGIRAAVVQPALQRDHTYLSRRGITRIEI